MGGPGAGKSTIAYKLTGYLKGNGIKSEYAGEYAKDAVWDENYATLTDQIYVFAKQNKRIYRLINKVDYVVTDSSLLLSLVYLSDSTHKFNKNRGFWEKSFENFCIETYNQYNNINFYVERGNFEYETIGRRQTEEESKQKDTEVLDMLTKYHFDYQCVKSIEEIIKSLGV